MRIILATGIFPPEIGGPAAYVENVAREFAEMGHEVRVITYGENPKPETRNPKIFYVKKKGGPIVRWMRYAKALKTYGGDADRIYVFTSVSAGVPLMLARLKKPEKILRLGGDFFWERYTDNGGELGLRDWYRTRLGFWRLLNLLFMGRILRSFDMIAYSTSFQRDLHQSVYKNLPRSIVIENARPEPVLVVHQPHVPFRLLFMGRFVRFKNIQSLLEALAKIPDAILTIVGSGPQEKEITQQAQRLGIADRVTFRAPVSGDEKKQIFDAHDLLVLPSLTEISPNVALEARAGCLPVLLTEETGLREIPDIHVRKLRTATDIVSAILDMRAAYRQPSADIPARTYKDVAAELLSSSQS